MGDQEAVPDVLMIPDHNAICTVTNTPPFMRGFTPPPTTMSRSAHNPPHVSHDPLAARIGVTSCKLHSRDVSGEDRGRLTRGKLAEPM